MKTYFAILVSLFAVDYVWLTMVAKGFYQKHLGYIFAEKFMVAPIVIFYILYAFGIMYFVVNPALDGSVQVLNTTKKSYTLLQVAIHNIQLNCWTAINGSVYELTDWIAKHPGGEGNILSICGKDGSAAFNNQHGGAGKPERVLQGYIIGLLK